MRMQRDQAGEECIHDPELTPDPGRLVRLDVTGEVGRARQEAGVMVSDGLELAGNVRGIPQKPHLLARADGDRSRLDRDTHGALELMKCQHQPALPGRHDNQVAGLVGGDQDRQTQLREQRGKTFRVGTVDVAKLVAQFGSWCAHGHSWLTY
jgi:hypothetical protein